MQSVLSFLTEEREIIPIVKYACYSVKTGLMEVRQAGTKMKLSHAKFEISDYHSGKNEKTTEKRGMYVQKKVKE